MTSTNDEKDVKSNQTSSQKGKSYFIELYKTLDAALNSECELSSRVQHVCSAWRRVHTLCAHSAATTHPHLLAWIQRHTALTILRTEWQSPKSKDEYKILEEAIDGFIVECEPSEEKQTAWERQLLVRARWLRAAIPNPWGHPVLRALLDPRGPQPGNDEILEWLKEERGLVFAARLRQLALEKCDDLALTLLTVVLDRVRLGRPPVNDSPAEHPPRQEQSSEPTFESILSKEAGFNECWDLLTDMELVLLHKRERNTKLIDLAKQTPLAQGYQLVDRLINRLDANPKEKKIWKNAKDVATLIAQVMITRCMVIPTCSGVVRTVLYWCSRALVKVVPVTKLRSATLALAAPASTARHLHTLASAVHAQLSAESSELKPFVVELYVRAITFGMNELEKLKLQPEYEEKEARATEQTLATWFVQLGQLLGASPRVGCECALTAFSLHPSPQLYDRIRAAPPLQPIQLDTSPDKEDVEPTKNSWANDSHSLTNFVKTSETLNLKLTQHQANVLSTAVLNEGEALGLNPELCQDIIVLLSGPRVKTLSWDMDRELLLENCRTYMERTEYGTRALTTELKYLNLDLSRFQHLPEEDDNEDDIYYGIEKGYEHLVEVEPQPEEIWEDAFDPDKIDSAVEEFDDDDEDMPKRRKKKKSKQFVYSSGSETDPLSLVAEQKKNEKKERPHSKERSKEPKEKHEDDSTKTEKPKDAHKTNQSKKKDKQEKKKEKKERKKRERKESHMSKTHSNIIGLKIAPGVPQTQTNSDYDSQGKSSLQSEGNDESVVYDGHFSMDELKTAQKKSPVFHKNLHKELDIASEQLSQVLNFQNPMSQASSAPHAGATTSTPAVQTVTTQSMTNTPNMPTKSKHTIREEVKKSISKLIQFRRPKSETTKSNEEIETLQSSNLSQLVGTRIEYNGLHMKQPEQSTAKKKDPKVTSKSSSSPKSASPKPTFCSRTQPYVSPKVKKAVHVPNQMPLNNTVSTSPQKLIHNAHEVSQQSPVHRPQIPQASPQNSATSHLSSYQQFLQQWDKSEKCIKGKVVDSNTSRAVTKIDQAQTATVITGQKESVSPQSAKITSQKRVENASSNTLNTFARLSYMHKNKNIEKVKLDSDAIIQQTVSADLERRIAEMQKAKLEYMSKGQQNLKVEVQYVEQPQSSMNLNKGHPVLLKNDTGVNIPVKKTVNSEPQKVELQSHPANNNTSLTEKDQQEILKLLGQQTLMNAYKTALQTKIESRDKNINNSILNIPQTRPLSMPQTQILNVPHYSTITSNKSISESAQNALNNQTRSSFAQGVYQLQRNEIVSSNNTVPSPSKSMQNNETVTITPVLKSIQTGKVLTSTLHQSKPEENKDLVSNAINKKEGTGFQFPTISNNTIIKTTAMVQNSSKVTNAPTKQPKCKAKGKTGRSKNCTVTANTEPNIEVNKTISKTYIPKPPVPAPKPIEELREQNWSKVMDALRAHKTPSRGPNALDMVTKIDGKAQNNPNVIATLEATKTTIPEKVDLFVSSILQEEYKKEQEKQNKPPQTLQSDLRLTLSLKSTDAISKVTQQKKTDIPKNTKSTVHKVSKISMPNPVEVMPDVTKQGFQTKIQKKEDPFISGIPNSDYEILEELMDDDLRQEIGELSSDEDNYGAESLSANMSRQVKSDSGMKSNIATPVTPKLTSTSVTSKLTIDPGHIIRNKTGQNSPQSMGSNLSNVQNDKPRILSNEKVDIRNLPDSIIKSVIRQNPINSSNCVKSSDVTITAKSNNLKPQVNKIDSTQETKTVFQKSGQKMVIYDPFGVSNSNQNFVPVDNTSKLIYQPRKPTSPNQITLGSATLSIVPVNTQPTLIIHSSPVVPVVVPTMQIANVVIQEPTCIINNQNIVVQTKPKNPTTVKDSWNDVNRTPKIQATTTGENIKPQDTNKAPEEEKPTVSNMPQTITMINGNQKSQLLISDVDKHSKDSLHRNVEMNIKFKSRSKSTNKTQTKGMLEQTVSVNQDVTHVSTSVINEVKEKFNANITEGRNRQKAALINTNTRVKALSYMIKKVKTEAQEQKKLVTTFQITDNIKNDKKSTVSTASILTERQVEPKTTLKSVVSPNNVDIILPLVQPSVNQAKPKFNAVKQVNEKPVPPTLPCEVKKNESTRFMEKREALKNHQSSFSSVSSSTLSMNKEKTVIQHTNKCDNVCTEARSNSSKCEDESCKSIQESIEERLGLKVMKKMSKQLETSKPLNSCAAGKKAEKLSHKAKVKLRRSVSSIKQTTMADELPVMETKSIAQIAMEKAITTAKDENKSKLHAENINIVKQTVATANEKKEVQSSVPQDSSLPIRISKRIQNKKLKEIKNIENVHQALPETIENKSTVPKSDIETPAAAVQTTIYTSRNNFVNEFTSFLASAQHFDESGVPTLKIKQPDGTLKTADTLPLRQDNLIKQKVLSKQKKKPLTEQNIEKISLLDTSDKKDISAFEAIEIHSSPEIDNSNVNPLLKQTVAKLFESKEKSMITNSNDVKENNLDENIAKPTATEENTNSTEAHKTSKNEVTSALDQTTATEENTESTEAHKTSKNEVTSALDQTPATEENVKSTEAHKTSKNEVTSALDQTTATEENTESTEAHKTSKNEVSIALDQTPATEENIKSTEAHITSKNEVTSALDQSAREKKIVAEATPISDLTSNLLDVDKPSQTIIISEKIVTNKKLSKLVADIESALCAITETTLNSPSAEQILDTEQTSVQALNDEKYTSLLKEGENNVAAQTTECSKSDLDSNTKIEESPIDEIKTNFKVAPEVIQKTDEKPDVREITTLPIKTKSNENENIQLLNEQIPEDASILEFPLNNQEEVITSENQTRQQVEKVKESSNENISNKVIDKDSVSISDDSEIEATKLSLVNNNSVEKDSASLNTQITQNCTKKSHCTNKDVETITLSDGSEVNSPRVHAASNKNASINVVNENEMIKSREAFEDTVPEKEKETVKDTILLSDDSEVESSTNQKGIAHKKTSEKDQTKLTKVSDISQAFKDSIKIVEIPIPGNTDPLKRCVRIILPNKKAFKATVHGKMNVSFDSLFQEPALKNILMNSLNENKRYTLNIQQVSTKENNVIDTKISNLIVKDDIRPKSIKETVNLVSDDDSDEDNSAQTFKTESGSFKIKAIDPTVFQKHQGKFSQKCGITLQRCDHIPKPKTDTLVEALLKDLIPTIDPNQVIELDSSDEELPVIKNFDALKEKLIAKQVDLEGILKDTNVIETPHPSRNRKSKYHRDPYTTLNTIDSESRSTSCSKRTKRTKEKSTDRPITDYSNIIKQECFVKLVNCDNLVKVYQESNDNISCDDDEENTTLSRSGSFSLLNDLGLDDIISDADNMLNKIDTAGRSSPVMEIYDMIVQLQEKSKHQKIDIFNSQLCFSEWFDTKRLLHSKNELINLTTNDMEEDIIDINEIPTDCETDATDHETSLSDIENPTEIPTLKSIMGKYFGNICNSNLENILSMKITHAIKESPFKRKSTTEDRSIIKVKKILSEQKDGAPESKNILNNDVEQNCQNKKDMNLIMPSLLELSLKTIVSKWTDCEFSENAPLTPYLLEDTNCEIIVSEINDELPNFDAFALGDGNVSPSLVESELSLCDLKKLENDLFKPVMTSKTSEIEEISTIATCSKELEIRKQYEIIDGIDSMNENHVQLDIEDQTDVESVSTCSEEPEIRKQYEIIDGIDSMNENHVQLDIEDQTDVESLSKYTLPDLSTRKLTVPEFLDLDESMISSTEINPIKVSSSSDTQDKTLETNSLEASDQPVSILDTQTSLIENTTASTDLQDVSHISGTENLTDEIKVLSASDTQDKALKTNSLEASDQPVSILDTQTSLIENTTASTDLQDVSHISGTENLTDEIKVLSASDTQDKALKTNNLEASDQPVSILDTQTSLIENTTASTDLQDVSHISGTENLTDKTKSDVITKSEVSTEIVIKEKTSTVDDIKDEVLQGISKIHESVDNVAELASSEVLKLNYSGNIIKVALQTESVDVQEEPLDIRKVVLAVDTPSKVHTSSDTYADQCVSASSTTNTLTETEAITNESNSLKNLKTALEISEACSTQTSNEEKNETFDPNEISHLKSGMDESCIEMDAESDGAVEKSSKMYSSIAITKCEEFSKFDTSMNVTESVESTFSPVKVTDDSIDEIFAIEKNHQSYVKELPPASETNHKTSVLENSIDILNDEQITQKPIETMDNDFDIPSHCISENEQILTSNYKNDSLNGDLDIEESGKAVNDVLGCKNNLKEMEETSSQEGTVELISNITDKQITNLKDVELSPSTLINEDLKLKESQGKETLALGDESLFRVPNDEKASEENSKLIQTDMQDNNNKFEEVKSAFECEYVCETEIIVEQNHLEQSIGTDASNQVENTNQVSSHVASETALIEDIASKCLAEENIMIEKSIKENNCDSNLLEKNATLVYKDDSGVILKGIEYEDPEIGTCYVFPLLKSSDVSEASELLNDSFRSTIEVVREVQIRAGIDSAVESRQNVDLYSEDLFVRKPKVTYAKRSLKRKSDMSEVTVIGKRLRRNSKTRESTEVKIVEKKYRKGKNIDYPKFSAAAIAMSSYNKEFKRHLDYLNEVKFSYSITYSKQFVDVQELLRNWPLVNPCDQTASDDIESQCELFDDTDDIENCFRDPLQLTLAEEITTEYNDDNYPQERNIEEFNYNMGFGEGSGRVIQNLDGGAISKFSAATLSDVKQSQPFLLSESDEYFHHSSPQEQLETIQRFLTYMKLKEKVRSFFKNTTLELTCAPQKGKDSNDYEEASSFPFELYVPRTIEPRPVQTIVQVVQVGQLPVSAAAQNPVTCDPRVTKVSDASPSQCSIENSAHDPQQEIKTEYTELTTAELNIPMMEEYVQHNQNMIAECQDGMSMNTGNLPVQTDVIKNKTESELTAENSEDKEKVSDSTKQLNSNIHMNNVNFLYSTNNANANSVEAQMQALFEPEKQEHPETADQKPQNGSSEKVDQIAHAMNAAGITVASETTANSRTQAFVNLISQKIRQSTVTSTPNLPNNFTKTTSINAVSLQQALAQILPPPLNQTNSTENNQQGQNTMTPQVLHIVQGKTSSGNQITLVDNSQQSVINAPNATPVLHIVQNKATAQAGTTNGSPGQQTNTFSGISLVDAGLQQGGNQLLHIVNTGSQKNNNASQLLKRVNLLTNLANVQGSNEQKMVQFVCKSADGKSIQLNAPHQRSMVLRLQPIETPAVQPQTPKPPDNQEQTPAQNNTNSVTSKDSAGPAEIKSRSIYEENYAKFIQNSSSKPSLLEKSQSLPKFNQAFGKPVFQDGSQNQNEINSNLPSVNTVESAECPQSDNSVNLEHIGQLSSPPLLLRKSPATTQTQTNLVQQIKQTIAPMNIQTMHGGVIYTRQIPVNIGGGQTINLITVPSTELVDENGQKQQINQEGIEPSIIKIVPQAASNTETNSENVNVNDDNAQQAPPQPQPVLTQMRIKLPMLSKNPQMVSGARVVRPSFFQIQRNIVGGANQQVYQQLVLTAAPPLGQQTIRLPQTQTRTIKVPESQSSSSESQLSSSTLEQLREFDMVLEQVKERSTVQPSTNSNNTFKLHNQSSDTTDSTASVNTSAAETTQVLYSIGSNQPLNVTYVTRKSTVGTPTTSTYVRSPDSSGIADSPTSSNHVQLPHTATTESSSNETPSQPKPAKVSSKSKSRPKSSTHTSSSLKLNSTVPPKTSAQKPLEDEQTTQRILYILAEYKEQVENSPDKDKPAPRRRSNPPTNPPGSSKRKKSSSGSRRSGRDVSPVQGEDTCRTMGSEDSSCGTSQGDCTENCLETHSPQDSPRKVARKLNFEQDPPTPQPQPKPQPQRNVIVADGQTITVARGTSGKPATAVLMPANYILPVSMVKGGQQIAIVTNRGPKLLTVGGGEGGPTNALLLQRLIGPAGLKPVLARPGVRHVRLPTTALHNLQAFNLATTTSVQPPDSTASSASETTPPDLIETNRNDSSPWTDRSDAKPDRASSPEEAEPWNLPSSADPNDYSYEETVRAENMDRTVLDPIQDRYSPDMEAQRIFDKMFDVDAKKSYIVDSVDSPRCAYDIDASDCDDKPYQVVHKKDSTSRQGRFAHVSAAALRHKYAILEHELRLQKSLSEECEDLGVDSPSASELFPEAELLFAASPAQEHASHDTSQHSSTPQPTLINQTAIQPDIDDQIATDQLIERSDDRQVLAHDRQAMAHDRQALAHDRQALAHDRQALAHDRQALAHLGLEDVGIVAVSQDGLQATIALDQEEFARSHPNTTFHSEPTDDTQVQPFAISGLKTRHITSTIFHSNRAPTTVLMTAPPTTVISQATTDNTQHPVKYANIDMMHSIPSTHTNNINLSSVLVKDDGLTRYDNVLTDSRELHLSNTASAIVHSAGNATQVIRRVCYEDTKRERENYLIDEPEGLIAGDDAKMVAEDSSRDATLESMGGDVDDDNSSPERHAELFWESNSASERSESRRPMDFSSDSEKCCKSPSYDETNSTDSSGVGTHMRVDSVIKDAREIDRSGSADGSSADDTHPPLRTYPPKRMFHTVEGEMERSLSGKTRAGERSPDSLEVRRRASGRGVVKRGCHCCNGSPAPPRPKKSRLKKPAINFTH